MNRGYENQTRSFVKAISYRLFGTLVSIAIAYVLTQKLEVSLAVGLTDVILKLGLFYAHERVWNKVSWGKKDVRPAVIWLTGLSGAGKSTLAERLYQDLKRQSLPVDLLDGDVIRNVFNDRGFERADRLRHIKTMGFMASHLEKSGAIVIAAFITPYQDMREELNRLCSNWIEVYVSTPLDVCESRDVKGLYRKARAGEINHFTGISDPFEIPHSPQVVIDTTHRTVDESYQELQAKLVKILPDLKLFLRS